MPDTIVSEASISYESAYNAVADINHRKKFAQFFTPYTIAQFLNNYILNAQRDINVILEPAFGLGVFSRILRDDFGYGNEIQAFEIDDVILRFDEELSKKYDVNLNHADYLNVWGIKSDCIICNPPYLKFHDYDNLTTVKKVNTNLNINLNGYTNLYALFILKGLSEISQNGRAAYIVPSEFFNADYGVLVKQKILESKMLKYVINFHFDHNIFDNALTTSTLLLFENSITNAEITFFNVHSTNELNRINEIITKNQSQNETRNSFTYTLNSLNPNIKWRNYYQNHVQHNSERLVNFRRFCKAKRGIATGANDYFTFNRSKAKDYNIKEDNLLYCISRSSDIDSLFFTQKDLENLINLDKKVFLADLKIWQNENILKYIRIGESLKIHERFLTKNRNPWYALEQKAPADIWVGVFNRDGIKFIKNSSKALNLTTFHGIYISKEYLYLKDIIFAYFLTDLAKEIFLLNKREYGNGLSKYEPNDFNNSDIFDFKSLTEIQLFDLNEIVNDLKTCQNDKIVRDLTISKLDEYFRRLL